MPAHTLTDNAVRKLRRALADRPGSTGGGVGGGVPVSYNRYAAPFTVRWAASLAQGESSEGAGDATSGEWIIWLPPGDLLHVSGETVDVTANLEAAGGDYPEGWYVLATDDEPIIDRDEGGALYLSLSGVFSGAASGGAIKICDVEVDGETGMRTVKQYILSSIIIGGAGLQPWTFRCTITPGENGGEETREGGWLMPRLQFGYYLVSEIPDPRPGAPGSFTAEELAQTEDGDYYIKCDSNNETFSLVRQPPDSTTPLNNDYRNGIVYFFVGTVSGGVQTVAPHITPVFYYYV